MTFNERMVHLMVDITEDIACPKCIELVGKDPVLTAEIEREIAAYGKKNGWHLLQERLVDAHANH